MSVLREINNQSATLILGMFALLAGLAIARDYAAFYARMSSEIASTGLNKKLQAFAENCRQQSSP